MSKNMKTIYCARCGKPISTKEAMVEKINGKYVYTHRECHAYLRASAPKPSMHTMIRYALDDGPGNALRRKKLGNHD